MISVLILTHNRPALFARCLQSVLKQLPHGVEVIVNNDSNDIVEVAHPQVFYHYKKFDSLCEIYKFLLEQSKGDYVYFLEDDDYLVDGFFDIELKEDMIVGNYCPTYGPNDILQYLTLYSDNFMTPMAFTDTINFEHLQLSQHIFKRQTILDFEFRMDSDVHNDIRLVLHAAKNCKNIKSIKKILYYQTIDGGDNISFPKNEI
jgi:glycosyltransferase involved in cell wall biosynthesis